MTERIGPVDTVSYREFAARNDSLAEQLDEIKGTLKEILAEAKKTNGRVSAIEVKASGQEVSISSLNREVFRSGRRPVGVVTKRDVMLVLGTLAVMGAVLKWLPALVMMGQVAP